MANFQSCKTVLSGLQSPAIYRLRNTWAYVRKKHASKYQNFELLCRFYRDPRLPKFQKAMNIVTRTSPFLPYLGDILAKLMGKVPLYNFDGATPSASSETVFSSQTSTSEEETARKSSTLFTKFLKVFTLPDVSVSDVHTGSTSLVKKDSKSRKNSKFKVCSANHSLGDARDSFRQITFRETVRLLEKGQFAAMEYNFKCNELARNYLLKARYDENKVNFYKSLGVESAVDFYKRRSK